MDNVRERGTEGDPFFGGYCNMLYGVDHHRQRACLYNHWPLQRETQSNSSTAQENKQTKIISNAMQLVYIEERIARRRIQVIPFSLQFKIQNKKVFPRLHWNLKNSWSQFTDNTLSIFVKKSCKSYKQRVNRD